MPAVPRAILCRRAASVSLKVGCGNICGSARSTVTPMSNHFRSGNIGTGMRIVLAMLGLFATASAQSSLPAADVDSNPNQATNSAPLTVTLQDAIARARFLERRPRTWPGRAATGCELRRRISLYPGLWHVHRALCGRQWSARIPQPGQCSPGYFPAGDRGIPAHAGRGSSGAGPVRNCRPRAGGDRGPNLLPLRGGAA